MQATPLMIDGVLYFNTALSQGVAVDAQIGRDHLDSQSRRATRKAPRR